MVGRPNRLQRLFELVIARLRGTLPPTGTAASVELHRASSGLERAADDLASGAGRGPLTESTSIQAARRYQPSEAELAVRAQRLIIPLRMNNIGHTNAAYKLLAMDWSWYIYKPASGERLLASGAEHGMFEPETVDLIRRGAAPLGLLARREVAAFRVDQLLNFGRVPPTALIERGPLGIGSLQKFVQPESRLRRNSSLPDRPTRQRYPMQQQEQMAVLDYVIGNQDRRIGNFFPDTHGNVVAHDHGWTFPEVAGAIRSTFFDAFQEKPLSAGMVAHIRTVDANELKAALADLVNGNAIDGCIRRLEDLQTSGRFPGAEVTRWR